MVRALAPVFALHATCSPQISAWTSPSVSSPFSLGFPGHPSGDPACPSLSGYYCLTAVSFTSSLTTPRDYWIYSSMVRVRGLSVVFTLHSAHLMVGARERPVSSLNERADFESGSCGMRPCCPLWVLWAAGPGQLLKVTGCYQTPTFIFLESKSFMRRSVSPAHSWGSPLLALSHGLGNFPKAG